MLLARAAFLSLVLLLTSCEQSPKAGGVEQVRNSEEFQKKELRPATWDPGFGDFIAYGSDSDAVVLLPDFSQPKPSDTTYDASRVNGAKVELFGPQGLVGSAVVTGLGKASEEEGCFSFSRGKVVAPPNRWSVALSEGRATGIPLESLSSIHGADSAELVKQVVALAGSVPGAQDSIWRDWPFTIDNVVRFSIGATSIIVAGTTRILPGGQHYSETSFFIGERDDAAGDAVAASRPFKLAYSHRTAAFGKNDVAESGLDFEDEVAGVTAVVMKSSSRPTLLLETRGNEVNGYAALGRLASGKWGIVWNGPHEGGC